jgi:DNA-binding CsgD family transcriptional regulator
MPGSAKRRGKRPLDGLVPGDIAAGHGKLYAAGGIPEEEAEEFLGGADVVRELADRGLAHVVPHTPTAPPSFHAVPPDLALMGLLAELQARATVDHELIMTCLQRLRETLPGLAAGRDDEPRHLARILTDKDEIIGLSMDLISSARRDWMSLENTDTDMPITEDFTIRIPPVLRGKVRCRAIYDQAAVEHPVAAANIEHAIAEGEEARVVPAVPMKMKLADESVALLPLSPTGSGGALLIRGSGVPILRALRDYFELKWASATRIDSVQPPPDCPLTPEQYQVLRLMAQGLTNDSIARRLKFSSSTMSRYSDAILRHLNVPNKSRFVAGVNAKQRGWLDDLELEHE